MPLPMILVVPTELTFYPMMIPGAVRHVQSKSPCRPCLSLSPCMCALACLCMRHALVQACTGLAYLQHWKPTAWCPQGSVMGSLMMRTHWPHSSKQRLGQGWPQGACTRSQSATQRTPLWSGSSTWQRLRTGRGHHARPHGHAYVRVPDWVLQLCFEMGGLQQLAE